MMKSNLQTGLFFCDVYNTYFCNRENHIEELKKFVNNLKEIKKIYNINVLYFSFITSDTADYIREAIDDIKYHLPDDIILSRQYFINGYIENDKEYSFNYNSKASVIIDVLKQYKNIICFYADDYIGNHYGLQDCENVISMILSTDEIDSERIYYSKNIGLTGVNDCLVKIKNQHR